MLIKTHYNAHILNKLYLFVYYCLFYLSYRSRSITTHNCSRFIVTVNNGGTSVMARFRGPARDPGGGIWLLSRTRPEIARTGTTRRLNKNNTISRQLNHLNGIYWPGQRQRRAQDNKQYAIKRIITPANGAGRMGKKKKKCSKDTVRIHVIVSLDTIV